MVGLQNVASSFWIDYAAIRAVISSSQPWSLKVSSKVSRWTPYEQFPSHMACLFIQITHGPCCDISRDTEGRGFMANRGNPIHFQTVRQGILTLNWMEHPTSAVYSALITTQSITNFSWYDRLPNTWRKWIISFPATTPWCLNDPS